MKMYFTLIGVFFYALLSFAGNPIDYHFDINEMPFSRYGSYLVISTTQGEQGKTQELYLREVSGKYAWVDDRIFKIELISGGAVLPFKSIQTSAALLTAKTEKEALNICFEGDKIIRMKVSGASIRITKVMEDPRLWEWIMPVNEKQARIHGGFDKYALTAIQGKLVKLEGERKVMVSGDFAGKDQKGKRVWAQFKVDPSSSGITELALERYTEGWAVRDYPKSFEACLKEVQDDFSSFVAKYPPVDKKYRDSYYKAAYANWSAVVAPRGILTRPTMLMSKGLMRHVWSWDHCFNALALAPGNQQLAWDQFMLFFDLQGETGALVDYANDHHVQIDFVKPPIHGLTLKKMMEIPGMVTPGRLAEVYGPLGAWTNFWFTYHDDDGDGLPQYNHGNDSGWDNASTFDIGYPMEGADLAAYLIVQMDVLSDVAAKLNKPQESLRWKERANNLQNLLYAKLWRADGFISTRSDDKAYNEKNRSLMRYLPMVLGDRLTDEMKATLLSNLKNSGLVTEYGLATEAPNSSYYVADGYWRGAIWPSSTYIIIEGIKNCGDVAFATDMAHKFLSLCDKSGFRENFDALTGAGLRDYGYTWTSSVFLVLAREYPLK